MSEQARARRPKAIVCSGRGDSSGTRRTDVSLCVYVRINSFMIDMCKNMTEDDYLPAAESDFGSDMLAYDDEAGDEPDLAGEEMQEMILDMFLRADDDGNGYLDRGEFKRVL